MINDFSEWAEILFAIGLNRQIQFRANGTSEWTNIPSHNVLHGMTTTTWPVTHYRVAPDVVQIGVFEVPGPMRGRVMHGARIYMTNMMGTQSLVSHYSFDEKNSAHHMWLKRGLLHTTQEAAMAHAKALLSFTDTHEEVNE